MSNEDNRGATSANEAEGEYYTVQEGDCIDSLAQARGHVSETLWSHPRNTHLSRKGRTSNTLLAGDVLFIPAIRAKKHSVETGKKHSFVRRGIPIKLKLRILRSGKPRSREPFRLFASGRWITGITDEDGRLEVPVSPGATDAELYIGSPGLLEQRIELFLGGMDPVNEASGIQKRLQNLGYACEITNVMDEQTKSCIEEFQSKTGIEPNGEVNEATRQKLLKAHGS